MPIDIQTILRLFSDMSHKRSILETYNKMSTEEFRDDPGRILAVEHALQVMIQSMIDISLILLKNTGRNNLETYLDAFEALADEKIINLALLNRIHGMPGFRNILVHGYTKVSEKLVIGFMQERLGDFVEFENQIMLYIKTQNS